MLIAGYPILIALYAIAGGRRFRALLPAAAMAATALLVWAPLSHLFDSWVRSHDVHHLRSHMLGFMVRGSNPVTLGEYLLRYELLDESSAPEEKEKVMLSVLATESARQPLLTLGVLPVAKAAKLFSIGHAAAALVSSQEAGYPYVAGVLRAATDVYAPLFLFLCGLAILYGPVYPRFGGRLVLLCWFIISAALAVVFAAETSAVYSHGFQPVLTVLAAAGTAAFRHPRRRHFTGILRATAPGLAAATAVLIIVWIAAASGISFFARHAGKLLFRDMSGIEANVNRSPVPAEPLNRWTKSWEQRIVVPANTPLPAKLHLRWPGGAPAPSVRMSVWIEDAKVGCDCQVVVPNTGRAVRLSESQLARMPRGDWPSAGTDGVDIEILSRAAPAAALPKPLVLNFGYAY